MYIINALKSPKLQSLTLELVAMSIKEPNLVLAVIYWALKTKDPKFLYMFYTLEKLGKSTIKMHKNLYTIKYFNMFFYKMKSLYTLNVLKAFILLRILKIRLEICLILSSFKICNEGHF